MVDFGVGWRGNDDLCPRTIHAPTGIVSTHSREFPELPLESPPAPKLSTTLARRTPFPLEEVPISPFSRPQDSQEWLGTSSSPVFLNIPTPEHPSARPLNLGVDIFQRKRTHRISIINLIIMDIIHDQVPKSLAFSVLPDRAPITGRCPRFSTPS